MESLPKYLASLISTLTPRDPVWAFRLPAMEHPHWRPLFERAANRRAEQLRGEFLSETLLDDSEDHTCKQAMTQISGRGRGLGLFTSAEEGRNWSILKNTAWQGTMRRYEVRIAVKEKKLASAHMTIQDAIADTDNKLFAILVQLLHRQHIRGIKHRLDLSWDPRVAKGAANFGPSTHTVISKAASDLNITPQEAVARAVDALRTALHADEAIDTVWARTVIDLVDLPWDL